MSVTNTSGSGAALVISGWAAISPYGMGADAFAAGVAEGRDAVTALDGPTRGDAPYERAGTVPDFDIRAVLGRKGTRSMDRATALAVATTGLLLDSAGPGLAADVPEDVGMVLGTGHGSVQSIMDFTRDSLTGDEPFHVDPARFPNTVMNRAAGQSAIWHTLKGPNTTLAGGALTGLLALNYAVRLLAQGHARAVLAGAVEEFSVDRAWLEYHARSHARLQPTGPLGEGCALYLVESAVRAAEHGRKALAAVLGSRFVAFHSAEGVQRAVGRAVTEVLKEAGAEPDQVALVVPSDTRGPLGAREESAVAEALGGAPRRVLRVRRLVGDTSAASSAFQLAAALAAGGGELALITSVDADGTAGCSLLRLNS